MNVAQAAGRVVWAAGVVVALGMGAGCASPGNYWYETRYMDVRPSARTLENGPYQLSFLGHALWLLLDSDPALYLTDEMREQVAEWMPMPKEEVNLAHLAWYVHRAAVAQRGSTYECPLNFAAMAGKSVVTSKAYTDTQRQLFNWLTWKKESLYRGDHRKKLRFAYFLVGRDFCGEKVQKSGTDIEYWVCLFDKDHIPIKTACSRALRRERVAALRVAGGAAGKQMADVQIGEETVTMWNPMSYEEADQLVIGGLLVEALNAMDEEDFARLDYED